MQSVCLQAYVYTGSNAVGFRAADLMEIAAVARDEQGLRQVSNQRPDMRVVSDQVFNGDCCVFSEAGVGDHTQHKRVAGVPNFRRRCEVELLAFAKGGFSDFVVVCCVGIQL